MRTRSIDIMLSRPGIYAVESIMAVLFVEVEPGGRCHQLVPRTLQRDGELRPGRWRLQAIACIAGPFTREQLLPEGAPR